MDKSGHFSFFKSELIALIFSAACAAVFIFISCAIAVGSENPDGAAVTGATLSLMITAFCGGAVASKLHKEKAAVCGATFGIAALGIIFIIGIIAKVELSLPFSAISAPLFAIIAVLGGIAGAGSPKSSRRKKPHRLKH